jgi:hypothetical protein
VAAIASRGGMRATLDAGTATNILWTLHHLEVSLLLVRERGWTPEQFDSWLAETLSDSQLAE